MPVTASHVFSASQAQWTGTVTVGNSTGGSTTDFATNLVGPSQWNQTHSVQFQLTGSEIGSLFSAEHRITLTTDSSGITMGLDNAIGFFEPIPAYNATSTGLQSNAAWYFEPIQLPGALNSGHLRLAMQLGGTSTTNSSIIFGLPTSTLSATSSGTVSKAATFYNRAAFYLRGTHSSATSFHSASLYSQWSNEDQYIFSAAMAVTASASSATSMSMSWNWYAAYPTAWNSTGGDSIGTFSGTYVTSVANSQIPVTSFTSAASSLLVALTGGLIMPIGLNTRLSAGEWFVAFNQQVSTQSAAQAGAWSIFGMASSAGVSKLVMTQNTAINTLKYMGNTNSNSGTLMMPGLGYYGTSNSTIPSPIGVTDIKLIATNTSIIRHYWNYQQFSQ